MSKPHFPDIQFLEPDCGNLARTIEDRFVGRRLALFTEKRLLGILAPLICAIEKALPRAEILAFEGGESRKSRPTKSRLEDALLRRGFSRDSVILALGGGTVTDLVGFTAGTFLRGVPYINIPTTLLAMVDAAHGGKVAVNTRHGKNLIGMFHLPSAVFAPLSAIETLPKEEFLCGLAESIKHGLVADGPFFSWLNSYREDLFKACGSVRREMIVRSSALKLDIVKIDPFEESGARNLLNAGHTVAHSIEALSGFSISHGIAVAMGLAIEGAAAVCDGFMNPATFEIMCESLNGFGLLHQMPSVSGDEIFSGAKSDKKNRGGKIGYVPLAGIGKPALPVPHVAQLSLASAKAAVEMVGRSIPKRRSGGY